MSVTIHINTMVLPGHRIEVASPELPQGRPAAVTVTVEDEERAPKRTIDEILAGYPGPFSFHTAEEVDAYLRAERDSWDE